MYLLTINDSNYRGLFTLEYSVVTIVTSLKFVVSLDKAIFVIKISNSS